MRIPAAAIALVLALPAAAAATARAAAPAPPRNVLLLAIDTLRADHMGLYGYDKPNTPELEAFAADATTFLHAYSPSAWTRSSFATYFTGMSPTVTGCETQDDALDPALPTLAELFRDKGFATAGIYANDNIAPGFGFEHGFDLYDHPPLNAGYPGEDQVTDAASVNERVLRWLRDERPDRPWFLFVLYIDPHDPYLPHPELGTDLPRGRQPVGSRAFVDRLDHETDPRRMRYYPGVRRLYDGEVAWADAHVGAVLDELKSAGLLDDTLVIVTADHGEELWDHEDFRSHGKHLYDGETHVPLIVRWPGAFPRGATIDRAVGAADLYASLVEAYGLDAPQGATTTSLSDALDAPAAPPIPIELHPGGGTMRALVDWPWKLIRDERSPEPHDRSLPGEPLGESPPRYRLYDLARDPGETASLADSLPDRVWTMSAVLDSIAASDSALHGALDLDETTPEPSEQEKRNLRALGYVH